MLFENLNIWCAFHMKRYDITCACDFGKQKSLWTRRKWLHSLLPTIDRKRLWGVFMVPHATPAALIWRQFSLQPVSLQGSTSMEEFASGGSPSLQLGAMHTSIFCARAIWISRHITVWILSVHRKQQDILVLQKRLCFEVLFPWF